ncbi:MAG TPA: PLP-dependent aminotransferase family protein [Holophaga sp.]|nr:PLP-dependent aminotransferase family protein [Holophaga sp.]
MSLLDLANRLVPDASEPLALQLARLLASEILAGRLRPEEAMPSSRTLAQDLGLSRHVAMSALRELEMEGWVESRAGSGTYVASAPPTQFPKNWGAKPERGSIPEEPAFELSSRLLPVSSLASTVIDLTDGFPDARMAPKAALAKGYNRAIQRHGDELLGRGEPKGNRSLREQLAGHLRHARGMVLEPEHLLITRSTTMSLTLIAQALVPKGGEIAVENPGSPAAWEALRATGARLHPVPVDEQGLRPEALESLAQRVDLALLHLTPRRHFPTTVPLSEERRQAVMGLAKRFNFAVVEDDPDAEITWEGAPPLPMAAGDSQGRVVHLGSLAHLLAPGLGLAYLVAPSALVDRLARLRQHLDLQGDRVLEWAMADLIRDGDLERHLARTRKQLRARCDTFQNLVREILGTEFQVMPCDGGLACWFSTPPDLDGRRWAQACLAEGVRVHPGAHYDFEGLASSGFGPGLRLGFAQLEPVEARKALELLRRALDPLRGAGHA